MWTRDLVVCLVILAIDCNGLHLPRSKNHHESSRVCVIGAGYSGLATARYLQQYGVNFTVFEATKYIGGTWRFDPHVGHDEDGVPVFTSAYKGLRTNTPRQTMEYEDFPMPKQLPGFIFGECFYKYLQSFSKHFDLLKYIQFRSLVKSIKWRNDRWELTYLRTDTKQKTTETFDFIVVATGYFEKPYAPKFDGQDSFKGKIIHSHHYKNEKPYVGKTIAIVGDGPSGRDLVSLLAKVAKKILFSHHHYLDLSEFDNVITKPDIKSFKSNGIIFQDNTIEEVDAVILCTGYVFEDSILDQSTELAVTPKTLMPLYEHMVNIKHPSMVFVGKSKTSVLKVYDAQAQYAAALAAQKFDLPSMESMLKRWMDDVYLLVSHGLSFNEMNLIPNINRYYSRLRAKTGLKRELTTLEKTVEELKTVKLYATDENDCADFT